MLLARLDEFEDEVTEFFIADECRRIGIAGDFNFRLFWGSVDAVEFEGSGSWTGWVVFDL